MNTGWRSFLALALVALGGYASFEILRIRHLIGESQRLEAVAEGTRRLGSGPTFRLWIAGDSLAAGYGASSFQASFAGRLASRLARSRSVVVTNVAEKGARMEDVLAQPSPDEPQHLVVVAAGSNDLVRFSGAGELERATREVADRLETFAPRVVFIGPGVVSGAGLIPYAARPLYALLRPRYLEAMRSAIGQRNGALHVDPVDVPPGFEQGYGDTTSEVDRFHLSDEGHRWWADRILNDLATLESREKPSDRERSPASPP